MVVSGFILVFVLVFALGAPLLLWTLIESETDDPDVIDRQSAEASARADSRAAAENRARQDTDDGRRDGF